MSSKLPLSDAMKVAPRAGAWIEAAGDIICAAIGQVAPRAGAWIEALSEGWKAADAASLPVRERGLKHLCHAHLKK